MFVVQCGSCGIWQATAAKTFKCRRCLKSRKLSFLNVKGPFDGQIVSKVVAELNAQH